MTSPRLPFGNGPFARDKSAARGGASSGGGRAASTGPSAGLAHAAVLSQLVPSGDRMAKLASGPTATASASAGSSAALSSLVAGPGGTLVQVQIPEHVLIFDPNKPELCSRITRSHPSLRDRFQLLPWESYAALLQQKETKPLPIWCPDVPKDQSQIKIPILYFPHTRQMKITKAVYQYVESLPGLAPEEDKDAEPASASSTNGGKASRLSGAGASASAIAGASSAAAAAAAPLGSADSVAMTGMNRLLGKLEQRLSSLEHAHDQALRDNVRWRQLVSALQSRVASLETAGSGHGAGGRRHDDDNGSSGGGGGGSSSGDHGNRRFATFTSSHRRRQGASGDETGTPDEDDDVEQGVGERKLEEGSGSKTGGAGPWDGSGQKTMRFENKQQESGSSSVSSLTSGTGDESQDDDGDLSDGEW